MSVTDLLPCQVFVYDLDGTVYEEVSHFTVYGEEIARRLPSEQREAFFAETKAAFEGHHALRYGVTYDPSTNRVFEHEGTKVETGESGNNQTPSDSLMHVDDPWGIYGAMGARFGLSRDDLQAAFLATRGHMQSEAFQMVGLPGLRDAINSLRSLGRKAVLATNSPEPDSRAILEKLGLTGAFDEVVFNAQKPSRVLEHFRRFHEMFHVPYSQMVSIGDHYRNEIQPAYGIGMKTVYIDRYLRLPRPDVSVQLSGPAEIASLLNELIQNLEAQDHRV